MERFIEKLMRVLIVILSVLALAIYFIAIAVDKEIALYLLAVCIGVALLVITLEVILEVYFRW